MMHLKRFMLTIGLLVAALGAAADSDSGSKPDYLRLTEDAEGRATALQVAVVRFERDDGVTVDLVGAVHIADAAYFAAVDQRLAGYEVVLYELVGSPEELEAPPAEGPLSLVGLVQGSMSDTLGLTHQLGAIDYGRDNMVHADLSRKEFTASMTERGESVFQLMLRAWAFSMTKAGQEAAAKQQTDLFMILFADDRQLALKRAFAGQLAEEEMLDRILSGPEGSTLIQVRNQRALQELDRQLADGAREIAIFYGAGHLADFSERLERDYGFERSRTEWLTAWDLSGG